jgi:photosystem II stability/assembly factor-like uncharacterized protein
LYKSIDGGESWRRLKNGLPEGVNGRIGVAVSQSRPEVVYTLVENKNSGIFRSEDKGESWARMCDKKTYDKVNFRPFYYSKITVDPNNDLVVYAYSGSAYVSEDGGKTFREIGEDLHADHHRIWVDPNNSNHIIDGNDGGIDVSWDRGKSWYPVENSVWSEVYQLGFDMRDPYYVYVGLQDNGSWAGPSNSRDKRGIMNFHWYPVGGGDGFYAQVDPRDHNYVYRNLQMGNIERFEQNHGQKTGIMPQASLDDEPYRFNWNSPIYLSPHNPDILYFGGNFLFKSMDRGDSWEKVSPDLSTNDPKKIIDSGGPISPDNTGAEVHCTIYTISESPVKAGILWVGTDDGNLWVSRDSGQNWENVVKNIKGLPPYSWVSRVEASHFSEGTVYVTFDRHRSDDYAPYVYKSDNFGKTWKSLRGNLPRTGYLHVIREDLVNPDLLYLGSEFGLFFSFDRGKRWLPFKNGFPTTAVRDIAVHPRENDLIVGTHGRGAWILDDISPLRQLSPDVLSSAVYLFETRPATIYYERKDSELYAAPVFSAANPPFGASIAYYLEEAAPEDQPVQLHIYDAGGKLVRTLDGTGDKGINRVYWDLRGKPVFKKVPEILKGDVAKWMGLPKGPFVLPGDYKIVLQWGETKLEKLVTVKKDKNLDFPLDQWKENQQAVRQLSNLLRRGLAMVFGVKAVEQQFLVIQKKVDEIKDPPQPLKDKMTAFGEKLDKLKAVFSVPGLDMGFYRRPLKLALKGGGIPEQIYMMHIAINEYPGRPTQTQLKRIKEIQQIVTPLFLEAMTMLNRDIPELNDVLRQHGLDFITPPQYNEYL